MTRGETATVVGTHVEAQLMAEMLRSNGVPAWVSTDDAGGMQPALETQGVRVMVPFAHAAAALRLVGNAPPEHRWAQPVAALGCAPSGRSRRDTVTL